MMSPLIIGALWVILGLALVFMAGYWWRDGHKTIAVLSLVGGITALVGQMASFLAALGPALA